MEGLLVAEGCERKRLVDYFRRCPPYLTQQRKHKTSARTAVHLNQYEQDSSNLCKAEVPRNDTQIQYVPHSKHPVPNTKARRLMPFRQTIAVCIGKTKHMNIICE